MKFWMNPVMPFPCGALALPAPPKKLRKRLRKNQKPPAPAHPAQRRG